MVPEVRGGPAVSFGHGCRGMLWCGQVFSRKVSQFPRWAGVYLFFSLRHQKSEPVADFRGGKRGIKASVCSLFQPFAVVGEASRSLVMLAGWEKESETRTPRDVWLDSRHPQHPPVTEVPILAAKPSMTHSTTSDRLCLNGHAV